MNKFLKLFLLVLVSLIYTIHLNAQGKKTYPVKKQYVSIMFLQSFDPVRKVPVYSDVRVGNEKLAFIIYQRGIYQVDVEMNKYAPNPSYYKLYNLDGKYLGYIPCQYIYFCEKPKIPSNIEMVHVEGGTFDMGDNTDLNAAPVHKVTVSDFDIMKYEITLEQVKSILGKPFKELSWKDIQEYIKILNKISGKKYRLPTEAEWEYAARGGKYSKGYIYSGSNKITDVAICRSNSTGPDNRWARHTVGILAPNELGIYDMSGNMCEMCLDKYEPYPEVAQTNPCINSTDKESSVIIRGGSYVEVEEFCKTTKRSACNPLEPNPDFGFRLVLDCSNKAHKTQLPSTSVAPSTEADTQSLDTAVIYDSKEPMQNGFSKVMKSGKFGILSADDKEILPCSFSIINDFKEGLAFFNDGQLNGAVNTQGKIVFPCAYENVEKYDGNLYLLKKGTVYGVKDKDGKTAIPFKYSRIGKPSEDGYYWAVFHSDDDDTYNGNLTLKKLDDVFAVVPEVYKKIKVLHKDGTFTSGDLTNTIPNPNEEYYYIEVNGKYGIIGLDIKTNISYNPIGIMDSSKLLWAKDHNGDIRILKNGEEFLGPYDDVLIEDNTESLQKLDISKSIFTNNDYYYIKKNGLFGIIDKTAKVLVAPQYLYISKFSEDYAVVKKDNTYGYIDEKGNIVIQPSFVEALEFSEGLAAVRIEGKKGFAFIDKTGEVKIKPINCDAVGSFKNGACAITKGDKTYNIDINGKKIKN